MEWKREWSDLFKSLVEVQGTSGDEAEVKNFILDYVQKNSASWRVQPKVIHGEEFQDTVMLVFGEAPKRAVFAHTDTIGFTVGYGKNLIKIGGPRTEDGFQLVGEDSQGKIETELLVIEQENGSKAFNYIFGRDIDRGTPLSFKPNFRETETTIHSPYLDNRLGCLNALILAETMESGALVFSTYEEHGGNSVGFCAKYLQDHYGTREALISDITWVTDGVKHGGGVAISMRDSGIPRRKFLKEIIAEADQANVTYQLEVESAGGSDGTALQKSHLSYDWLFIGAPEDHVHSPNETVYKFDFIQMVKLYQALIR